MYCTVPITFTQAALGADLDLFGVIALGVVTATGGGVFRDIVLGSFPPEAFVNPMYVAVAAATSLIVFLVVYIGVHTKSEKDAKTLKRLLLIMDSAGLAMFTVMGVNTAFHTAPDNAFLCVFAGVLTGVGGGLVRDILVTSLPYIFTRHIYAIASIIGGMICTWLMQAGMKTPAIWGGAAVILIIRLLSAHYHWKLPKVSDKTGKHH